MMDRHFIVFVTYCIIFCACQQKSNKPANDREEIVHIGSDTIIKQVINKDGDTISQCLCTKVADSFIPNGYYREFYENKKLKILAYCKNGKADSVYFSFSRKGVILGKHFFQKGLFFGQQYDYYDNGSVKRIFNCVNDTLPYFSVEYTKGQKIYNIKGKASFPWFYWNIVDNIQTFKNSDTILIVNFVPVLPKVRTALEVNIFDETQRAVYSVRTFDFFHGNNPPAHVFHKRLPRGKYQYISEVYLIDSTTNNKIKDDTCNFRFVVK